jgi:hypothetical protein
MEALLLNLRQCAEHTICALAHALLHASVLCPSYQTELGNWHDAVWDVEQLWAAFADQRCKHKHQLCHTVPPHIHQQTRELHVQRLQS